MKNAHHLVGPQTHFQVSQGTFEDFPDYETSQK